MIWGRLSNTGITVEVLLERLRTFSLKMQQVDDLDAALDVAVREARALLGSDRVLTYHLLPGGDGVVLSESVDSRWRPLQGQLIYDPCFQSQWHRHYQAGQVSQIDDADSERLAPCYRALLTSLQVRANLVVPILLPLDRDPSSIRQDSTLVTSDLNLPILWGLLIAHECGQARQWQPLDTQVLQQIALELGRTIQHFTISAPPRSPQPPTLQFDRQFQDGNLFPPTPAVTEPLLQPSEPLDSESVGLDSVDLDSVDLDSVGSNTNFCSTWCAFDLLQTPIWILDLDTLQLRWANQAALPLWQATSRKALLQRNLRAAAPALTQVQTHLQPLQSGHAIATRWMFLTTDHPVVVECCCSPIPVGQGELGILVEGRSEATAIAPSLVSSAAAAGLTIAVDLAGEGYNFTCPDREALPTRPQASSPKAILHYQEALLKTVTNASPLAFYVVDNRTDTILYFNHRFCEIWGLEHLEPELLQGRLKNQDLIPACLSLLVDVPAFAASCEPLQREENRCVVEDEIAFVDGRTIRRFSSQIRDADDRYFGRLYIFEDITERKQIEAALHQESQRLATIIATQQDIAMNRPNLEEVMALIINRTQHLTQADGAVIEVLEADELVYRATSGIAAGFRGLRLKCTASLSGHCIATGEILQCDDVEKDERVNLAACRQIGLRSMLVVPLQYQGDCIGVLKVLSQQPAAFSVQATQTLQLMAGFLAATLCLSSEFEARNRLLLALQDSEDRYRSVVSALTEGIILQQSDGKIIACNASAAHILGLSLEQLQASTTLDPQWQTIREDGSSFPREHYPAAVTLRTGQPQFDVVMGIYKPDATLTWISINSQPLFYPQEALPYAVVTSFADITMLKQTEVLLRQQSERERMIHAIAQTIRQSLDLERVLKTTVTEVRHFLQTDRVIIYRFNADWSGVVVTESVAAGWQSILNLQITDTYFVEKQDHAYRPGAIQATSNIYTAGFNACHIELLERLQVQAKLVVPIWQEATLWGLLVAHHCSAPREWQPLEIELLMQLATQVAIAIQQSELHAQVRQLNTNLEQQVQERTAELRQALDIEASLKRITDKVRDSLDENQILQVAVQELATTLGIECCDAALYSADRTTSTIQYEFIQGTPTAQDWVCTIAESSDPHLYSQLFQGMYCHFCLIHQNILRPDQGKRTTLACPIMDDQGVLGDLWLFKPGQEVFQEMEIRLVQQVANQCAIGLRQSRLYQAAQQQVEELERLNQLKDDFLSTVSHELRTPVSSIKNATQMLNYHLHALGLLRDEATPIQRYLQILQEECQQEINLIDDLLNMTRLEAGTEPLNLTPIPLQFFIPHIAESFLERCRTQQQQLLIAIPETLPSLTTDMFSLERIVAELLLNACKYTPSGETIQIAAQAIADDGGIEICIRNSGVEIPAVERDRIFDKFYRIPNHDPWKYGGTGLGLALVKKLVELLQGRIQVSASQGWTTFTVSLPLSIAEP